MRDQLTIVQEECTRLLMENRELKRHLSLNEYQTLAARTAEPNRVYMKNEAGDMVPVPFFYPALGLGEAGEVQNKIKKIVRDEDGIVDDDMKIAVKVELGDTLWYISETARALGLTLEEVARVNVERLRDRQLRGKIRGSGDNR